MAELKRCGYCNYEFTAALSGQKFCTRLCAETVGAHLEIKAVTKEFDRLLLQAWIIQKSHG